MTFHEALATLNIQGGLDVITTLAFFIVGVSIYSIFVFKFYRFISQKDIFKLRLTKYAKGGQVLENALKVILYILQYLVLFPIVIMVWFGVFSLLLAILSEAVNLNTIMLGAMSLVASVRIASYYNEELSKDLSKMIPFALLGILLIDVSLVSFTNTFLIINQIHTVLDTIVYYTLFTVALEFFLRIINLIFTRHISTPERETD